MPSLTSLSTEIINRILILYLPTTDYSAVSRICRKFRDPAQDLIWRSLGSLLPILKIIPAFTYDKDNNIWYLPALRAKDSDHLPDGKKKFDKFRRRVRHLNLHFCDDASIIFPDTIMILHRYFRNKPRGLFPNLISLDVTYSYKFSYFAYFVLPILHSPVLRGINFEEPADLDRPINVPELHNVCQHVEEYLFTISTRFGDTDAPLKLDRLLIERGPSDSVLTSISTFRNLSQLSMDYNYTVPISYEFIEALSRFTKLDVLYIMAPNFLPPSEAFSPSKENTPSSNSEDSDFYHPKDISTPRPRLIFPHLTTLHISSLLTSIISLCATISLPSLNEAYFHFWVHESTYSSSISMSTPTSTATSTSSRSPSHPNCNTSNSESSSSSPSPSSSSSYTALFSTLHSTLQSNPLSIYLELIPIELLADATPRFANMFNESTFPSIPFSHFSSSFLSLNLADFILPDPLIRDLTDCDITRILTTWTCVTPSDVLSEERRRYRRVGVDIKEFNEAALSERVPVLMITPDGVILDPEIVVSTAEAPEHDVSELEFEESDSS